MRSQPAALASLGEFAFLERLLPGLRPQSPDVLLGVGDDCAVVRASGRLVLTIDAFLEGVHFEAAWMTPRQIGAKAFAINASDIAAMGGTPRWALVALAAPATYSVKALFEVERGIVAAARAAGCDVIGGNLSRADRLGVTIAMIGETSRPLTRAGAQPGDAIYITGTLGDSALALRMLQRGLPRRQAVLRRFLRPQARLQTGQLLSAQGLASAAIDVSDGLVQDLGHLCRASRVGAEIAADALPLSSAYRAICGDDLALALHGGEDYELLFTVPPAQAVRLRRRATKLGCPVTAIGTVVARRGVRVDGATVAEGGHDHFRRTKQRLGRERQR